MYNFSRHLERLEGSKAGKYSKKQADVRAESSQRIVCRNATCSINENNTSFSAFLHVVFRLTTRRLPLPLQYEFSQPIGIQHHTTLRFCPYFRAHCRSLANIAVNFTFYFSRCKQISIFTFSLFSALLPADYVASNHFLHFYRRMDDKVLGGVCSSLINYFETGDSLLRRLGTVVNSCQNTRRKGGQTISIHTREYLARKDFTSSDNHNTLSCTRRHGAT